MAFSNQRMPCKEFCEKPPPPFGSMCGSMACLGKGRAEDSLSETLNMSILFARILMLLWSGKVNINLSLPWQARRNNSRC